MPTNDSSLAVEDAPSVALPSIRVNAVPDLDMDAFLDRDSLRVDDRIFTLASGAARLAALGDETFARVYSERNYALAQGKSLKGQLGVYLEGAGLGGIPQLQDFLYLALSRVWSAYAGIGVRPGAVLPSSGSFGSLLQDAEQGKALPAEALNQLGVVIPGMVASTLQEWEYAVRQDRGPEATRAERLVSGFLATLSSRFAVFSDNALLYSSRVLGEGRFYRAFDAWKAQGLLGDPALLRDMLSRVLDGNAALPKRSELYFLSQTLDASVRGFGQGAVALSDRFSSYPDLFEKAGPEGAEAFLKEGLDRPMKMALPGGCYFLNPVFFFRPSLSLSQARGGKNVTPVAMAYGFGDDMMAVLQKLLIGEVALGDFDTKALAEAFEACLVQGVPFDAKRGGQPSLFEQLKASVWLPAEGMKPGASASSLMVSGAMRPLEGPNRAKPRFLSFGPRAVGQILRAFAADRPETAQRLLEHMRRVGSTSFGNRSTHVLILTDEVRQRMLENLGLNPFVDYFVGDCVPLVRVPAPSRIQGVEAAQDSVHKIILQLARVGQGLASAPESQEYLTRLQVLMGYYFLGAGAYEGLALPYSRLEAAPPILVGLLPMLEEKQGAYRLLFAGGRLPYSGRMVATADPSLPFGVVGVPARTMAVLRGHLVVEELAERVVSGLPTSESDVVRPMTDEEAFRALVLSSLFEGFEQDAPGCNLIAELYSRVSSLRRGVRPHGAAGRIWDDCQRRISDPAEFERSLEASFSVLIEAVPPEFQSGFMYLSGKSEALANLGYTASPFIAWLAHSVLTDPLVKDFVEDTNAKWPMIFSRYPRLHAQAFSAVKTVLNAVGDDSIRSHPLMAKVLNLDFDGDCNELIALRLLNPRFLELLERHSPDVSIFDAGQASGLSFGLDLNSLEGLIKANAHFVPADYDVNLPEWSEKAPFEGPMTEFLGDILPLKEKLLADLKNDPDALVKLYLRFLKLVSTETGDDFSVITRSLVYDPSDRERTTTLDRLFLHSVSRLLVGEEQTRQALGEFYLAPGELVKTSPTNLQASLVGALGGLSGPDGRPFVSYAFAAFYNLGVDMAVRISGSGAVKGLSVEGQFLYTRDDALVAKIRARLAERLSALELAKSRGFFTDDELTTAVLRVEHGSGKAESGAAWQTEYSRLRKAYLSSRPSERDEAYKAVVDHLSACLDRLDVGLKPLLRSAFELACDKYEFEFGCPNIWVEQLLTATLKAKEEILARSSMGTVNTIDGRVTPTTFDDLLGSLSADAYATAGIPSLKRSVDSKVQVPVSGEFLKDALHVLDSVRVGRSNPNAGAEFVDTSDYFSSELNVALLANRLRYRTVRLNTQVEGLYAPESAAEFKKECAALTARLQRAVMAMPFDVGAVVKVLTSIHHFNPGLQVGWVSPMKDPGFPRSISPEAVGVHPMEGVVQTHRGSERRALVTLPHVGVPIGSISAGALGEDKNQAALKTRHVGGSSQEAYATLSDYWRMKYGPFPQRSPYFRVGATQIKSSNPLSEPALSGYTVAFTKRVPQAPDTGPTQVTAHAVMHGVEVFPGETFLVKDGILSVGSDRPEKLSFFNLKPGCETSAAVEKVVPDRFSVTVTADQWAKVFGSQPSADMSFVDGDVSGRQVSGFSTGALLRMAVRSEDLKEVLKVVGNAKYEPMHDARYRPAQSYDSFSFYRVRDSAAFYADNGGSYVPAGALIDPASGSATVSTKAMTSEVTTGFMVFLDHLKSRALSSDRSVLAPSDGVVSKIVPLGVRGDFEGYTVTIAGGGKPIDLHLELPRGHFPSVVEGQRLEAGDPLSYGYVAMADRAKVRPEFAREFRDYVYAYSEDSNLWSLHADLLARSLVTGPKLDKFVGLGDAYQSKTDERLLDGREGAERLGKLRHVVTDLFLGRGGLYDGTIPYTPNELAHVSRRTDPSVSGAAKWGPGYRNIPEDLAPAGRKAVRESTAALGFEV